MYTINCTAIIDILSWLYNIVTLYNKYNVSVSDGFTGGA